MNGQKERRHGGGVQNKEVFIVSLSAVTRGATVRWLGCGRRPTSITRFRQPWSSFLVKVRSSWSRRAVRSTAITGSPLIWFMGCQRLLFRDGFTVQINEGRRSFLPPPDSRSFLDALNHSGSTDGDVLRSEVSVSPASCQRIFGSMCSVSSESPPPPPDRYVPPPTLLWYLSSGSFGALFKLCSRLQRHSSPSVA